MIENNGLEALRQQIEAFIKAKNPEIFALTGKWGVGKTFALKNVIDDLNKSDDTKKILDNYAYVSLFGLRNIDDVKSKIFTAFYSMAEKGGYFSKMLESVSCDYENNGNKFSLGGLIGGAVSLGKDVIIEKTLQNKIICFDDFERTSIDTQELLGFLQDLKEERNCNIILIYNEEKLENGRKKDFDTYREKVVDKHFDYTPSSTETVALAFKGKQNDNPFTNIQDYQAFITEKCEVLKLNNIRIIQKILKHISNDIQPILKEINCPQEVNQQIFSVIILYAFLYFQKENDLKISKEDFEQNFNLVQLEKHYAKIDVLSLYDEQDNEDFKENQKKEQIAFKDFHAKRVLIQGFICADFDFHFSNECKSEIQAISNHLIQLIKAGYLLNEDKAILKTNIQKFSDYITKNTYKKTKYDYWLTITKEIHNKLVNNDYPQRFYQAAKDVVTFENIDNIDFIVRFLKEHNMPKEAQEIIDLFIDGSENYIDYDIIHFSTNYSLNIERMDTDLKEACNKRYQELYKKAEKESLYDFCIRRYIKNIYNPQRDEQRIKSITKDEMKDFLLGLKENLKTFGCSLMTKTTIEALYEIYQNANQPRKIQIRTIFGDTLREVYPKEFIDERTKSMIDDMLKS